ncbi:MAG TPA: hypothetical protein DDW49_06460 [Deltaproteobacteria bacterium]|nr:MAG: hypothetical protein A2048_02255 [Deltaproteobacteria bacterium GWA2_45_12]HBF13015.1 hypothetical protein [Deltaproteobacteria bacterium]
MDPVQITYDASHYNPVENPLLGNGDDLFMGSADLILEDVIQSPRVHASKPEYTTEDVEAMLRTYTAHVVARPMEEVFSSDELAEMAATEAGWKRVTPEGIPILRPGDGKTRSLFEQIMKRLTAAVPLDEKAASADVPVASDMLAARQVDVATPADMVAEWAQVDEEPLTVLDCFLISDAVLQSDRLPKGLTLEVARAMVEFLRRVQAARSEDRPVDVPFLGDSLANFFDSMTDSRLEAMIELCQGIVERIKAQEKEGDL